MVFPSRIQYDRNAWPPVNTPVRERLFSLQASMAPSTYTHLPSPTTHKSQQPFNWGGFFSDLGSGFGFGVEEPVLCTQ